MQSAAKPAKLIIKDGLIVCPVCKQKTNLAVNANTWAKNLQLWCRACKAISLVEIEDGQCYLISRCR